jgi:hypothetical protein
MWYLRISVKIMSIAILMEALSTSEIGFEVLTAVSTKMIALMMEAARTSETLVNFYQTTRHNVPEDSHLHL